jgi:hypothetical protein
MPLASRLFHRQPVVLDETRRFLEKWIAVDSVSRGKFPEAPPNVHLSGRPPGLLPDEA